MNTDIELTFDEFREWALGQGADEVLVREWEANREVGNQRCSVGRRTEE